LFRPPSAYPEEDRSDEIEVGDRIAVRVVDGGAVDVHVTALARLLAVAPFVVARRVDDRVLEGGPEVEDLLVVGFRAELLAGMNVAHVEDEIDFWIVVDRRDEGQSLVGLCRVVWRQAVREVAVDRDGQGVVRVGIDGRTVLGERNRAGQHARSERRKGQLSALHRLCLLESDCNSGTSPADEHLFFVQQPCHATATIG